MILRFLRNKVVEVEPRADGSIAVAWRLTDDLLTAAVDIRVQLPDLEIADAEATLSGLVPKAWSAAPQLIKKIEGVRVGDDQRAGFEVVEVGFERRRIHRDQAVGAVTWGEDVPICDVNLERGNAGDRPGRGTDLGREVWERGEVVAEHRRASRELGARQLHPVPGVPCESNDNPIDLFRCRQGVGLSV